MTADILKYLWLPIPVLRTSSLSTSGEDDHFRRCALLLMPFFINFMKSDACTCKKRLSWWCRYPRRDPQFKSYYGESSLVITLVLASLSSLWTLHEIKLPKPQKIFYSGIYQDRGHFGTRGSTQVKKKWMRENIQVHKYANSSTSIKLAWIGFICIAGYPMYRTSAKMGVPRCFGPRLRAPIKYSVTYRWGGICLHRPRVQRPLA